MVVNYSKLNYPRKAASNRNVLGARKPWLEREAVHLTVEYFITLRKLELAFSPSWTMTLKVRSNSLDSRAICNMNFWCVLPARNFKERLHVFVPFVPRIPSRSTDVHLTIQFVRFAGKNGKETKKRERKSGEWLSRYKSRRYFLNEELYVETSNYVQWANMDVYLYKCENTRRILSLSGRERWRGMVE